MGHQKIDYLENLDPGKSGLKELDSKSLYKELEDYENGLPGQTYDSTYIKYLGFFLKKNYSQLISDFSEDPSLISSFELKALDWLCKIITKGGLKKSDFKILLISQNKNLEHSLRLANAKAFVELYESLVQNINNDDLDKVDIWSLAAQSPELGIYFSQYFLIYKIEEQYKKLFDYIQDINDECFSSWKYYLLAFYYRRTGDNISAEKAVTTYALKLSEQGKALKIKHLGIQRFYAAENTLKNWSQILAEYDEIQSEAELRMGLHADTCNYFNCSDCCSYTYPSLSYTEFQHLKAWMQKTGYPIEKIITKSKEIQKQSQKLFGEALPIVDKTLAAEKKRGQENPNDLKFDCPFLSEQGQCTCYEARPILCRGYGSSSDNDFSLKACHYYRKQYQAQSNPDKNAWVVDLREIQMLARSSDKFLSKKHGLAQVEPRATIPAWFTTVHLDKN